MPYDSINGLPNGVKSSLPADAQEIYRSTYNAAYIKFKGDDEHSHRTAWAAVKQRYEQSNGRWRSIGL